MFVFTSLQSRVKHSKQLYTDMIIKTKMLDGIFTKLNKNEYIQLTLNTVFFLVKLYNYLKYKYSNG